jgi:rSAM/selenodomain-associated transferase 2
VAVSCSVSIIIPVWNETSIINDVITSVFALPRDGEVEVIVVDGSPGGETIHAIDYETVKTAISQRGRPHQMNKGASLARGEILLFLHADTTLPGNALPVISSVMKKRKIVGGAFDLGIQSGRPVFRIIERAASLRSRITRIPYGDQAIFMRRDYFEAIGGFREIPLMEDVEIMRRIKRAGQRISIIPDRAMTSVRRWEREGVLRCTLRNWTLITLYLLGVSPEKLARFYR